MSYVWEKFHLAMHSLAGNGSQTERLIGAAMNLGVLMSEDIPDDIRDEFKELMHSLTYVPAKGGEGLIQATVDSMDELERSRVVEKIISFHDSVTRRQETF